LDKKFNGRDKQMTKKEQIKKELPLRLREWFQSQSKWKTQTELARFLGINPKTLNDYFNGHNNPRGENLKKLADLTHLPILLELQKNEVGSSLPLKKIIRDRSTIIHHYKMQIKYIKNLMN
jgi:transcriptional regulator with XRE-family HTH domain